MPVGRSAVTNRPEFDARRLFPLHVCLKILRVHETLIPRKNLSPALFLFLIQHETKLPPARVRLLRPRVSFVVSVRQPLEQQIRRVKLFIIPIHQALHLRLPHVPRVQRDVFLLPILRLRSFRLRFDRRHASSIARRRSPLERAGAPRVVVSVSSASRARAGRSTLDRLVRSTGSARTESRRRRVARRGVARAVEF